MDMQTSHLLEGVFNTADGVFAVDEGQRIIFWNRGAEAILGYSPDEILRWPTHGVTGWPSRG